MSETRRQKVIVVGAGGHARVVVSLLSQLQDVEVIGVADRTSKTVGEIVGSSKVIMSFDELSSLLDRDIQWAALAIGDNRERSEIHNWLKKKGFLVRSACHPTATVEPDAEIAEGAVICAGAVLGAGSSVGIGTIINSGAIVDHETTVSNFAHVGPTACLAGRVTVGEYTFIGAGSCVIDKITIGSGSIIGAGSVVVENIPNDVVAFGVPARTQRHV